MLAAGYRRIFVDLYWSVERRKWTFCPATVALNAATPTATTGAAKTTPTASPSTSPVQKLGAYSCTDDLGLSMLFDVLSGYFGDADADLDIHMTYVIFNLHAVASTSSPNEPASTLAAAQLPARSQSLGSLASDAIGTYVYSPSELAEDRNNLDESWFEVPHKYKPITDYLTIHENHDGGRVTPDGWPCSKYVQYASQRRLLLGYGSVDPQLQNYNLARDNHTIFPPEYLTSSVTVSTATDRSVQSGCLYQPDASAVSQANSSWAESSLISFPRDLNSTRDLGQLTYFVRNLTACGLSPMLNSTLFNTTADSAIDWYKNVSRSSTWTWATGEPREEDLHDESSESKPYRCAVMDVSLTGHWRATNCTERRHAACRVDDRPFTWTLSTKPVSFSDASDACPDKSKFAIPRTGLENTYLYHHLLSQSTNVIDPDSVNASKREVWLDFNCIDVQSCWVTGGADATCPYKTDPQQLQRKTVVVAAVASIIICVITALTLFVKCNANRRNSRRRKRVIEGWEYEGVPS